MSPWPWRMGAAALRPLSSCSQGVSAGAYGKWGAGTAERYKETLWYSALSTRPYRPDDCGIQGAWNRNHPKVFDQITRYNMVLKVDYLIVSNGLQHYCCRIDYEHNSYTFLQDIPGASKLIGGATNSPLLLSSHRIIYHAWYAGDDVALSSSVSYESTWRRRQCSISGRRKDNEAGIIICSFHTVGIAVGRAGLVSYYCFGWQHTFQFVGTGFSIYHGLPQEVFQLLVGEQLFFISRSQ